MLPKRTNIYRGTIMTELLVAATLFLAGVSILVPLTVRTGRVWQDTQHYHLAVQELSNQLETLTQLADEDRDKALRALVASDFAHRGLPNPQLTGEQVDDDSGRRVVLQLNWDRPGPAEPVVLVGWIAPDAGPGQPTGSTP